MSTETVVVLTDESTVEVVTETSTVDVIGPSASGTTATATTTPLTAGEDIDAAEILSLSAPNGRAQLADADYGTGLWFAVGVATTSAVSGATVSVHTTQGGPVRMKFASAPPASANGDPVFLSQTAGQATLTPPGSGAVTFLLGILQGANGSTDVPYVLFQPQYISRRP